MTPEANVLKEQHDETVQMQRTIDELRRRLADAEAGGAVELYGVGTGEGAFVCGTDHGFVVKIRDHGKYGGRALEVDDGVVPQIVVDDQDVRCIIFKRRES